MPECYSVVIVTPWENLFVSAFEKEGINILQQQLFCFHCRNFMRWEHNDKPEYCPTCRHTLDTGEFARPDIVMDLASDMRWAQHGWGTKFYRYGVVRVDGKEIHLKNRKHMMHDYHQFTKFWSECQIPVFIVYNHELKKCDPWVHTAMARYFFSCLQNPEMYERYLRQGSIIERTMRPLTAR